MLPRTYLQPCKSSIRRIGCTQVCPACGCGRAATEQRFFLLLCDGTKRIVLILLQHVMEICSSRYVYQCRHFHSNPCQLISSERHIAVLQYTEPLYSMTYVGRVLILIRELWTDTCSMPSDVYFLQCTLTFCIEDGYLKKRVAEHRRGSRAAC